MTTTGQQRLLAVAGALFLLVVAALLFPSLNPFVDQADDEPDKTPAVPDSPTEESQQPECDPIHVVVAALEEAGFDSDLDFVWVEDDFDLSLPGAQDAGAGSFSSKPLTNLDDYIEFVNADSSEAVAAREHFSRDLSEEELERLLAGDGVVGIQFLVDIEADGNTLYDNGLLRAASQTREVVAGDIWWFFVDSNCELVESATIRGTCANPQDELPRPKPKEEPSPEPPKKDPLLGPNGEQPCPSRDGVYHPACQPVGPDPGPTEGYEEDRAEEVVQSQEDATGSNEPSPHGQPADDSSGTPGSTTHDDPDGSTNEETGGSSGDSSPEDTEGSDKDNEEEVDNPF